MELDDIKPLGCSILYLTLKERDVWVSSYTAGGKMASSEYIRDLEGHGVK